MTAPSSLEVTIYERRDPTGPDFIGYIVDGKSFLPLRFEGATMGEARSRAVAWWDAEQMKAQKRDQGLEARRVAMRIAREAKANKLAVEDQGAQAPVPTNQGAGQ